jgi:hypothetical protein
MTNKKTTNDAWLDELIAWADEKKIPEEKFPRDKEALFNLTAHIERLTIPKIMI